MRLPEISPAELCQRIAAGERWTIVDVREAAELAIASIADAVHIPMSDVPARMDELDPGSQLAVLCHSGGRSARVTAFLIGRGYSGAYNVAGGIDRWATDVDPALARY